MIIISVQNLFKSYGYNPVLEDVSFEVKAGDRIGFVGPNGAGKTTLFRMLCGMETVDKGQVFRAKDCKWAYLPQTPQYPSEWTGEHVIRSAFHEALTLASQMRHIEQLMGDRSLGDRLEVLMNRYQAMQERFEQVNGYQIEATMSQVINGLGITKTMLTTPFEQLSGGEKTKIGLAKILCEQSDVLLLDEPTNHLDVESMEWLEKFLLDYAGTILIISHDRYFLDAVATTICDVDNGSIQVYEGNYSFFIKEKEERLLREFAEYQEQQKKIKKMKETIKRLKEWANQSNPPNAGLHRRAKSMEKALERMEKIDRPKLENEKIGLQFHRASRSGEEVIVLEDIDMGFGEKQLLNKASLLLRNGERKALLGPNGCGKSTLIKMVMGQLEPLQGKYKIGPSVKVGYLSQQAIEGNPKRRVIEVFRDTVDMTEGDARHVLAKFLFYGEQVFKRLENLSGGERMRLRLAQLMHQEMNLLILDEPTNHLDIDSRETLEEAIANFRGSLLIISHDRYFLQKVVDGVFYIENQQIVHYEGTYQETREKRQRDHKEKDTQKQGVKTQAVQSQVQPKSVQVQEKREAAPQETKRVNTFKIKQLEEQINEWEKKRDEFQRLLASGSNDYEQLQAWQQEVDQCETRIAELYEMWEGMQS